MPTVVLVGTLDTKGAEYDFVRAQLHDAGVETVTIDCGVLQPPLGHADISREEVARAAGEDIATLAAAGDRGRAVQAMSLGAEAIVLQLYNVGRLQAALALG